VPETLTLTEDAVHRLAPDTDAVQAARTLLRKKSFLKPGISADATWLLAECQGSGSKPYEVSVDLADPSAPTFRCSCPSRKFPCKHGLGLLLLYAQSPEQFSEREPDADLLSKREKKAARAEKKAEAGPPAPRKVNKAALSKKTATQRDGLDLLEKLVVDLVKAGEWFDGSRLDKLERQAKQLTDAYLPGARHVLRELVLAGRDEGLSDEERTARGAELIARLWATVRKGRDYLDGKLAGDESQAEADAVIEDVLGKTWQLSELKEKGYIKNNLSLLELAFEATDSSARRERVEVSHLIELTDGTVYQAIAYRPFKGMQFIPEQPSYSQPLQIAEAAVYPGFINRRIRWEKGAEKVEELKPAHWAAAYNVARPDFKLALDTYRQQLKNPLAPREAVLLLRCERLGRVDGRLVLEDAGGTRVEAVDSRADYSNVANLARAGGMVSIVRPAVLVRLMVQPVANAIVAVPLALVTPECHLRLGM
jgi:hypothetical protein